MKTAIYTRVSTEEQSSEMQKREILAFLQYKQLSEYENYCDEGYTGSNEDRPDLIRLVNDIKMGKVETLVVWKLDRLFRSLSKLLAFMELVKAQNVKFIAVKDNIDITTPMGMCYLGIFGAIGQFEREMIKERTKSGLANAKAKGIKLGAPVRIGNEIKSKVLELRKQGLSYKVISKQTDISVATAHAIVKQGE